jgi:hypothetical protein
MVTVSLLAADDYTASVAVERPQSDYAYAERHKQCELWQDEIGRCDIRQMRYRWMRLAGVCRPSRPGENDGGYAKEGEAGTTRPTKRGAK